MRVAPGSVGCQPTPNEVCYAVIVENSEKGLTLSDVRFYSAVGTASQSGPIWTPISLGDSARVSALGPPKSIVGVWNYSEAQWTSGSGWGVPTIGDFTLILDTGLLTNSTLEQAYFFVEVTGPFHGGVGFPFACAEC